MDITLPLASSYNVYKWLYALLLVGVILIEVPLFTIEELPTDAIVVVFPPRSTTAVIPAGNSCWTETVTSCDGGGISSFGSTLF